MSFFKKLFTGIAVGALVGLTGGIVLGAIGGGGITTLTGAALYKAATLYGAVYGGLQGAAAGFIKKPKMPTNDVQARTNISVDPQALGKWIFGETAAGTDIVYSENIDDKQIVHVIAAAAHEIDSYGDLYINDEQINLSGTDATGDWAGALSVYRNLGTTTQDALIIPDSDWPTTAKGAGMAHYAMRWDFSTDAGKQKLSGGIPTRITQVVKGAKVYDPRKDTTRGGSGSHRADDQSTWEWSANWALIVAHYLLGYTLSNRLIYGVGVSPDEIDWQSVAAMADVCDQTVDSKPRYRIGGIFSITQDHESIIGQLESAIGGKVSLFGGKYYLWVPHNDLTSVGTLTDDNIVGDAGIQYTPAGPLEDLFNTARGQYVEPSILYQLQPYAEIVESTAVTEDGRERLLQQDFPMIQDESIAQRVARELVRRSRFSGTIRVVVGPIGLLVKPFDVVEVNFRETNFTNELFRVISMQYSAGGAVIVELLEEDASIYDTTVPLGTPLTQLDPNAYDPSAPIPPPTNLVITEYNLPREDGTINAIISLEWTASPSAFVREYELQYKLDSEADYFPVPVLGTRFETTGQIVGQTYDVRIRAIGIEGNFSDWLTDTYTIQGDIVGPEKPVGFTITGDYKEAVGKWTPSTAPDYKETILYSNSVNNFATATEEARVSGSTIIYYDLPISTTFYVWIRHVDFSGNLGPVSDVVTFNTTSGVQTGQIANGAVTNAKLDPNAVAANVFASGVQPISVFATVPGTKSTDTIFVTSTAKLYRWSGSSYVKSVDNDDIVSMTADKLTAGTINAAITTTNILQLSTNGRIYTAGKTTAASTTAGVFLGHDGGTYKFTVGNATNFMAWNGSSFTVSGEVVALGGLASNTSKTFDGSNFMFELGTSTIIAGYGGAGIFRTQKNTSFGIGAIATGADNFAVVGQSTNSTGSGYAGGFVNSTTSGGSTHRTQSVLCNSANAGLFLHVSSSNLVILSNPTYAVEATGNVYVDGNITATGTITPFTGSHDGVLYDTISPDAGDIMVDTAIIARSGVDEALSRMDISSAADQCAIGVYAGDRDPSYLPKSISEPGDPVKFMEDSYVAGPRVLTAEYETLLDDSRIIGVNSVGEGLINVCGENGNISAGDLIVTSSMAGKGMKQSDDIIRAKTVAKARESVSFDDPSDVKQIACIYLCG